MTMVTPQGNNRAVAIKISETWLRLFAKWWSKQETYPESVGSAPGPGYSKLRLR